MVNLEWATTHLLAVEETRKIETEYSGLATVVRDTETGLKGSCQSWEGLRPNIKYVKSS
jgi:hypothetical protein